MLMITFFIDKGKKIIGRLEDHMKSHYNVKKPILIEESNTIPRMILTLGLMKILLLKLK